MSKKKRKKKPIQFDPQHASRERNQTKENKKNNNKWVKIPQLAQI